MNQNHDELHNFLPSSGECNAFVQIGFEPSSHLNAALQRFLVGNKVPHLLSGATFDVHVQGGSSTGVEIQRDEATLLANEANQMKRLHGAQLSLGKYAMMSRIDQVETKGLQIRLGLRPSYSQRQLLSGHVLAGTVRQPLVPILATMSPHRLVGQSELIIAKKKLDKELQSDDMMYATNPYITSPRLKRR